MEVVGWLLRRRRRRRRRCCKFLSIMCTCKSCISFTSFFKGEKRSFGSNLTWPFFSPLKLFPLCCLSPPPSDFKCAMTSAFTAPWENAQTSKVKDFAAFERGGGKIAFFFFLLFFMAFFTCLRSSFSLICGVFSSNFFIDCASKMYLLLSQNSSAEKSFFGELVGTVAR